MSKAEDALRDHQGQLDPEGIMVSVSRQAVGEVLKELAELREWQKDSRSELIKAGMAVGELSESNAEKDKRIGTLEVALERLGRTHSDGSLYFDELERQDIISATQPKPDAPIVPSEGEG